MNDFLVDHYITGPDGKPLQAEGKPEADGKEKPNPFKERARDYRNHSLKMTVLGGVALIGIWILGDYIFEQQKKESKGGEECYSLWQKVEVELRNMQAEDYAFKKIDSADATRSALDGYQKAKTRMNERFSEKARTWINCLDKQKKNAPAAVQPKPLARTGSKL